MVTGDRRGSVQSARAIMWERDGRWHGIVERPSDSTTVSALSRAACLLRLRRAAGVESDAFTVEVLPALVGVAEAAALLGWDKRRIFTYISRGRFPEPVAMLASGRVWLRSDVEAYSRQRAGGAGKGSSSA